MKTINFLALTVIGLLLTHASMGQNRWRHNHPRRAEVNARLNNQNRRINREVKSGEISRGQAAAEHAQVHQTRTEERAMAAQNGGHITKTEQRALNQQENANSRRIGK